MAYIRVKDTSTGHEFDALESSWQIEAGIYVPVKSDRYPPAATPRPAKHKVSPVRATNERKPSNG